MQGDRPPPRATLSKRAWTALLASSVLPVASLAIYMGAPIVNGLEAVVLGWTAEAGLLLVSLVELGVGLAKRQRLLCLDGALRALLVLALMSPLGLAASGLVPIGWSFVQSFNPAYACQASPCEDAIVDSITIGGELLTPQCYIELVRLSDPRGGREAAVRTLRQSWPSFGPADTDKYADEAGLMPLGRGFYRAERCEDWNAPRSTREQRGHGFA